MSYDSIIKKFEISACELPRPRPCSVATAMAQSDEEPMVVDGGSAGLEQSRHHPNAGASIRARIHQRPSKQTKTTKNIPKITDELYKELADLI